MKYINAQKLPVSPAASQLTADDLEMFTRFAGELNEDAVVIPKSLPAVELDDRAMGLIEKYMLSGWSAEYAFRLTPILDDEEYLRQATAWTFPEAYYAVMFSLKALLVTTSVVMNDEHQMSSEVSGLIRSHYYPAPINAYVTGRPQAFHLQRIAASSATGKILLRTREVQFFGTIPALPSIFSTTFFDVMKRLRMCSIAPDVCTKVSIESLHRSLERIISYINHVHEQQLCNALGAEQYGRILKNAPYYLTADGSFLEQRIGAVSV